MAWERVEVHKDEVIYLSHAQFYDIVDEEENHVKWGGIFTIPVSSQLELGDTFTVEGNTYQVDSLDDLHSRGEVFHVNAVEVKHDKSKARTTDANNGTGEVPSKD